MARVKKKQRLFSKIDPLSLEKLLSRNSSDRSLIGRPGFSRIVYCNDPECPEAEQLRYCDNYVTTTKYTLASFLPKSLFEQFRRIANLYFLLCAFLSFTPISPNPPINSVLPLVVVVAVTMVKELVEDCKRRKQVTWMFDIMVICNWTTCLPCIIYSIFLLYWFTFFFPFSSVLIHIQTTFITLVNKQTTIQCKRTWHVLTTFVTIFNKSKYQPV